MLNKPSALLSLIGYLNVVNMRMLGDTYEVIIVQVIISIYWFFFLISTYKIFN
jgi:hypothetical protein